MAKSHQVPILNKRQTAQHILQLIQNQQINELLNFLGEMPESKFRGALTPIYPRLSNFIKRHWFSHVIHHPSRRLVDVVMTNTSVNYINHIGCSCGKKINPLFLTDEIVQHMSCINFIKNILSHLPITLRRQHIFYLAPSYREMLKRRYKARFHLIEQIYQQKKHIK